LAGLSAAADLGAPVKILLRDAQEKMKELPGPVRGSKLVMAPVKGKKSFICFDEDTTVKNINQGCDMGFDAVELSKRFTAAGTGPGQGGIPGHNLPLIMPNLPSQPFLRRSVHRWFQRFFRHMPEPTMIWLNGHHCMTPRKRRALFSDGLVCGDEPGISPGILVVVKKSKTCATTSV
jgi:hypothetical protein